QINSVLNQNSLHLELPHAEVDISIEFLDNNLCYCHCCQKIQRPGSDTSLLELAPGNYHRVIWQPNKDNKQKRIKETGKSNLRDSIN
ncbi:unnamed protein product, partial [Musa textilis]